MNKVFLDSSLYYKGVYKVTPTESINNIMLSKYGIKRADTMFLDYKFEIIDNAKFTLFMLEYPEYIIKIVYE